MSFWKNRKYMHALKYITFQNVEVFLQTWTHSRSRINAGTLLTDRQTHSYLFICMQTHSYSQIDFTSCMRVVKNKEAT